MAVVEIDDDLELWLPAEFLTDDDILTDFKSGLVDLSETDSDGSVLSSEAEVWKHKQPPVTTKPIYSAKTVTLPPPPNHPNFFNQRYFYQQQQILLMRRLWKPAVFVGEPGSRKGTGVFMPRNRVEKK